MSTHSLIFDIGCHDGRDSEFYLKKGFTVVAVEANPSLCRQLKQRFAGQIASGQFLLVEKAIAEQGGDVEFYLNLKASIWGTIRPEYAGAHGAATKIVVPSITFSELIESFGVPHYMKVDIEGADLLCVEGLAHFPQRPRFISDRALLILWATNSRIEIAQQTRLHEISSDRSGDNSHANAAGPGARRRIRRSSL